jgi:hypothetical protein
MIGTTSAGVVRIAMAMPTMPKTLPQIDVVEWFRPFKDWMKHIKATRYNSVTILMLMLHSPCRPRLHVTCAANSLCVSQPTLSGSLDRLRDYFQDDLIVQVGRRMELTPMAQSQRRPLEDVLGNAEKLLSTKSHFDHLRASFHDHMHRLCLGHADRQSRSALGIRSAAHQARI